MSVESRFDSVMEERLLRDEEKAIINAMLGVRKHLDIANTKVIDARDGGMGGVKFVGPSGSERHFSKQVAEAHYIDSDKVFVSITLNVDEKGDLFELDFWRVDFKPLQTYPNPSQIDLTLKAEKLSST